MMFIVMVYHVGKSCHSKSSDKHKTLALNNNIIGSKHRFELCRYPTYSEYVDASIEWQQGDYQQTQ